MKTSMTRIALIIITVCISFEASAIQRELFGITLGSNIVEARSALQKRYGEPYMAAEQNGWQFEAFIIDREQEQIIVVIGDAGESLKDRVTSVELKGLSPIGSEDVCGIRLGDPADRVLEIFPSANRVDAGDGYFRYDTDDNVSFETKADRVHSLKILIDLNKGMVLKDHVIYFSFDDLELPLRGSYSKQDIRDAIRKLTTTTLPAVSGSCAARRDVYQRYLKD